MNGSTRKILWNYAGISGLLLGSISTANMFMGQWLSTMSLSPMLTSLIGLFLWVAETGGCIYFMSFFMKRFAVECPEANHSAIFRMGMATAFLSALVYSAASFANMAYISADFYAAQFQIITEQTSSLMDANSRTLLENMMEVMPQITFFSNLIYCFIFGTVVSTVLSRNIQPKDPFADYRPENDEQ